MEKPVEAREGEVVVWTDGACSGNPGPGGWAAIVVSADGTVELSGGAPHTTNNRMEYMAALEGLRSLPAGSRVCVVTDSQLMLNSMTTWIAGWKRKGWKTAGGQPVKNQDLVRALDAEIARHDAVRWHWVRGHETGAEHAHKALNDRADRLAVAAAAAAKSAA
jgi:ribonuclease HI